MPRAFLALKGRYERPREDQNETQEDHNIEKDTQQTVSPSSDVGNGTATKVSRIWRPIKMEESEDESYQESQERNDVMEINKKTKSQETLRKRESEGVFEENGMSGYDPRRSVFNKAAKSHVSRDSKDWKLMPRPPGWCFCNNYDYDAQERYLMKQDASLLQTDSLASELGHFASKRDWFEFMEGSKWSKNGEIRNDYRSTETRRHTCEISRGVCNNYWSMGSNMDSTRRSIDSIYRKTDSMPRNIDSVSHNIKLTPRDVITMDRDMVSMPGSNDAINRNMDSIPRTIDSIHHRMDSISHDDDSVPQSMDHSMDSILRNVNSMPRKVDSMRRNYDSTDVTSDTLFNEGLFMKEGYLKRTGNDKHRKIRKTDKVVERKRGYEGTQEKERVENAPVTSERSQQQGENFSDESQQTDLSERPYVCHICKKSFKRRSSLATHKFIHTDLKPHICTTCDKKFLRKSDLKKHSLMHSGKKPYRCEKCGRQFSQSSNMLTHMRRHLGIRPFVCTKCDRSFFRKVDLRRHEGRHLAKKVKRKPTTT